MTDSTIATPKEMLSALEGDGLMSAEAWKTVSEIASKHGMLPSEIEPIAIQSGIARSKVHARDSARGREYSPGAVLLIEREIRARAKQAGRVRRAVG